MIEHTVGDGKYTITYDLGVLGASRHGDKTWRDLTGDGMVLAMLQEIDDLKIENKRLKQVIDCISNTIEGIR